MEKIYFALTFDTVSYAASEVNHLYNLTKGVTLFTNGKDLEPDVKKMLPSDVSIISGLITAVKGTAPAEEGGFVAAVQIAPNVGSSATEDYSVQGVFVAIGTAGATDFVAKLGLSVGTGVDAGTLLTKENGATAISGIYSAGDATGGYMQIAKAVSDGAHVARAIVAEFRKK